MGSEKLVSEMTMTELEQYKHSPETELSALVCQGCESGNFDLLKDYLRVYLCYHKYCTSVNLLEGLGR